MTVYKAGDYFFEMGKFRTYRSEQDEFGASHIICGDSSKELGGADGCSTFGTMSSARNNERSMTRLRRVTCRSVRHAGSRETSLSLRRHEPDQFKSSA